jgi:hypothetical protein
MPLDPAQKSALRDKVSYATKFTAADVAAEVQEVRATLAEDDKDHARLGVWLEDLEGILGGKIPGKFS